MNIDIGEKCVTMNKEEQGKCDVVKVKGIAICKVCLWTSFFSFLFLQK